MIRSALSAVALVGMVVLPAPSLAHETAFPVAVCACEAVSFNGTVGSDSFDSREGPYDPVLAGGLGDVASNGDVTLAGTVHGDVIAGGDVGGSGTVTGDIVAGGTVNTSNIAVLGEVAENASPRPSPCACEDGFDVDLLAADAAVSNDNGSAGDCAAFFFGSAFQIGGLNLCTLPPGRYFLTSLRILGAAAVVVSPLATAEDPVELVFSGAGPFELGGNGIVNGSERAQALVIHSASAADLALDGTAVFAGLIDAPRAPVTWSSEIAGALVAGTGLGAGIGDLHYDEASLDREDYCPSDRDGDGLCDDDDPFPDCGAIASSDGGARLPLPLFAVAPVLFWSFRRRSRR